MAATRQGSSLKTYIVSAMISLAVAAIGFSSREFVAGIRMQEKLDAHIQQDMHPGARQMQLNQERTTEVLRGLLRRLDIAEKRTQENAQKIHENALGIRNRKRR